MLGTLRISSDTRTQWEGGGPQNSEQAALSRRRRVCFLPETVCADFERLSNSLNDLNRKGSLHLKAAVFVLAGFGFESDALGFTPESNVL